MQICDLASRDPELERVCGNENRGLLSKKSIKSLLESIDYLIERRPETQHHILLLCDNSSDDLHEFVLKMKSKYENNNIRIYTQRTQLGCKDSMRTCYDWLRVNGKDIVYMVQDDYLYCDSAVYEMSSIFFQLVEECQTQPIVISFNYRKLWHETYRNTPTPRAIFVGEKRYWIQSYDTPSPFLTSHAQLLKNWDIVQHFLSLPFDDVDLEKKSLNKMFTMRGMLGVLPINSVALHIQGQWELDPHMNWRDWWNGIDEQIYT
jgi:hypothetical protein